MKPKKLSPPKKDFIFYVDLEKRLFHEAYGSKRSSNWARSWKCNFNKITKEEISGYNIEWIHVPENVYNSQRVGLITIQYSTGSTFGREDGLLCVGCISHKKEIIEQALNLLRNWKRESSEETWQKLEEKYKDDAFFQSFYTFSGYFEFIESIGVDIIDFNNVNKLLDSLE